MADDPRRDRRDDKVTDRKGLEREQFEAWCVVDGCFDITPCDSGRGDYEEPETNNAWFAWQAARAAVLACVPSREELAELVFVAHEREGQEELSRLWRLHGDTWRRHCDQAYDKADAIRERILEGR